MIDPARLRSLRDRFAAYRDAPMGHGGKIEVRTIRRTLNVVVEELDLLLADVAAPRLDQAAVVEATNAPYVLRESFVTSNEPAANVLAPSAAPRPDGRAEALRQLLQRIRGWDMLDGCADGPYWKHEIDNALAAPLAPAAPPEEAPRMMRCQQCGREVGMARPGTTIEVLQCGWCHGVAVLPVRDRHEPE